LFLNNLRDAVKPGGKLIIITGNHFSPIDPMKAGHLIETFEAMWGGFKKTFSSRFIYCKPDLISAFSESFHDSDAVYRAHPFDVASYLKDDFVILRKCFLGPSVWSKIIYYMLPFYAGVGFVGVRK